ncbi:MAG: glucose dehydrogenase [Gaiellaceae bacterium]|nr:MAG: glucose dehydrogenase [Gaiellaceae bacterium]
MGYGGVVRALVVVGVVLTLAAVVSGPRASEGGADARSQSDSSFRLAVLTRGLDSPVGLAATPSEPRRLYVVEQRGTVRIVQNGRLRPGVFLDLRGRVVSGGEQGLLGLAFDPRYARNRFVYVNFTDRDGHTRIVRFRTNGVRALPRTARLLLRVEQPFANHNGGHLAFGPDGRLWIGLGDGGSGGDPRGYAQNMGSPLGKMLRLDVRRPGSAPEIVGLGLRNPWRYSFDRATGHLYIGDVGQGAVEEVNVTPRSELSRLQNYGWNLYEGSRRYSGGEPGPGRLVFPVFEYGHDRGCSVTGGVVYRGRARPGERGRYLVGDYCSGTVWSLRVADGQARDVRVEPFRVPSLTSFGEDAAGEVYATSHDGVVFRLS